MKFRCGGLTKSSWCSTCARFYAIHIVLELGKRTLHGFLTQVLGLNKFGFSPDVFLLLFQCKWVFFGPRPNSQEPFNEFLAST